MLTIPKLKTYDSECRDPKRNYHQAKNDQSFGFESKGSFRCQRTIFKLILYDPRDSFKNNDRAKTTRSATEIIRSYTFRQ